MSAQSQTAASSDEARRLFDQGVQALDEQRYAEAAELLQQSLERRDSANARYNRALALRGAGRYVEAIAEAERFIAMADQRRYAQARTAAARLISELRASLGHLRIVVTGGAQRVELDQEVVASEDGVIERDVDPGEYRVRGFREGYEPVTRTVQVAPGHRAEVRLDVSQEARPATLVVDSDPSDAQVRVDGQALPGRRLSLAPPSDGRPIVLEIDADGFELEVREVVLTPGETSRVTVVLRPTEKPLRRRAWLWALIGGIVAVGAGTAIAIWAATPDQEPPYMGTLGHVQALRN